MSYYHIKNVKPKKTKEELGAISSQKMIGLALLFAVFFPPATYAVPGFVTRAYQLATVCIAVICIILYMTRSRMSSSWVAFMVF